MSDPLKDAMSRAVDRIAPFPPNADALKRAAKRSQLRRRIVGGYLGLMLAGWLGVWAVSTINDNPDNERGNRRPVAGPISTPSSEPGDGRCCETYRDEELGFSVTYPSDWFRAEEKMTDISTPRELFTLGTFPLKPGGSCMPTEALGDVQGTDALIYAFEDESGDPDFFKTWPPELGLDDLEPPGGVECGGEQDVMRGSFTDSGRNILLFVALGEKATPELRQEASDVLGSLQFDQALDSSDSEDETSIETYRDDELGFSVTYPSDWFRAEEPMTKLVNPREILTLGTMSMSISDGELGDCAPTEPLSRLGPDGVLIFVTERENSEPDPSDFANLPSDLGLDGLKGPESIDCWDRDSYLGSFRASGRAIYIYVALGDDAGPERRQEVSDILGSLRFDPLD